MSDREEWLNEMARAIFHVRYGGLSWDAVHESVRQECTTYARAAAAATDRVGVLCPHEATEAQLVDALWNASAQERSNEDAMKSAYSGFIAASPYRKA